MAFGHPIGLDRLADGTGTTPADFQLNLWAQTTHHGIHGGCTVTGTSAMAYGVSAGALRMLNGAQGCVDVPIYAGTYPTSAAPASGSRTDTVAVSPTGEVEVFPGTTPPANWFILDKRHVPAGITATTGTTSVWDRQYFVPSTNRSLLVEPWVSTLAFGATLPTTTADFAQGQFWIGSQKTVGFEMTCPWATASGTSAWLIQLWINGQLQQSGEIECTTRYTPHQLNFTLGLQPGTQQFAFRRIFSGGSTTYYRGGGPNKIIPAQVLVVDLGTVQ